MNDYSPLDFVDKWESDEDETGADWALAIVVLAEIIFGGLCFLAGHYLW